MLNFQFYCSTIYSSGLAAYAGNNITPNNFVIKLKEAKFIAFRVLTRPEEVNGTRLIVDVDEKKNIMQR